MTEMYKLVAQKYAERINEIFASEDKLKECFQSYFKALEFTRTDHWQNLLRLELTKVWYEHGPLVKSQPVSHDVLEILQHLQGFLDYNLFSQVLLNLQSWTGWGYSVPDAKKELDALRAKYEGKEPSPFAPKAKMARETVTPELQAYNFDLSSMRALKIISEFSPMNSFRVSPKGSTPALTDSRNLSLLGMGADKYVRSVPGLQTYYITWNVGSTPQMLETTTEPGVFKAKGIDYTFQSKSGGETLNDALFSRMIATYIYKVCRPQIVLPRLNSVTIVATQASNVRAAFEELVADNRLTGLPTVLEFHEGSRSQNECNA